VKKQSNKKKYFLGKYTSHKRLLEKLYLGKITLRPLKRRVVGYKEDEKEAKHKLQQKKSLWGIRKKILRVVKHWSRLSREVAETLKI